MAVMALMCPQGPTALLVQPPSSCALLRGAQLWQRSNARRARPAAGRAAADQCGSEAEAGCTTSGRRSSKASPSGRAGGQPTPAAALAACAAAATALFSADPALAAALHAEPANALSLPTWAVHTSSVIEWILAMGLMYQYADATGNPAWRGMAWGMLPSLGGAMCACTWHFFYNSPDLEVRGGRSRCASAPGGPHFQLCVCVCRCLRLCLRGFSRRVPPSPARPQFLVALQALLTVVGNTTCWIAAYRIYKSGQEQGA